MTASIESAAMPRPAMLLRRRQAAMAIALIPCAMAAAWTSSDRGWSIAAGIALFLALVATIRRNQAWEVLCTLPFQAALVVLWLLPASTQILGFALLVLWIDALIERDDATANPCHPAMVACAGALVLFPEAHAHAANEAQPIWLAIACALGGSVLIVARVVRWQAPVGMLVGMVPVAIVAALIGRLPVDDATLAAMLPPFMLTAFFIVDDPPRAGMSRRARFACGFLAGAIAATAILALHATRRDERMLLALAGSVLLMNAAAPWLDRIFERPRAMRSTGISGP